MFSSSPVSASTSAILDVCSATSASLVSPWLLYEITPSTMATASADDSITIETFFMVSPLSVSNHVVKGFRPNDPHRAGGANGPGGFLLAGWPADRLHILRNQARSSQISCITHGCTIQIRRSRPEAPSRHPQACGGIENLSSSRHMPTFRLVHGFGSRPVPVGYNPALRGGAGAFSTWNCAPMNYSIPDGKKRGRRPTGRLFIQFLPRQEHFARRPQREFMFTRDTS